MPLAHHTRTSLRPTRTGCPPRRAPHSLPTRRSSDLSQPQAAILGTYAIVKRPWVVQDELGEDVIAIRPIMNLTLSYDHRDRKTTRLNSSHRTTSYAVFCLKKKIKT